MESQRLPQACDQRAAIKAAMDAEFAEHRTWVMQVFYRATGFMVGKVMVALKGRANPVEVSMAVRSRLVSEFGHDPVVLEENIALREQASMLRNEIAQMKLTSEGSVRVNLALRNRVGELEDQVASLEDDVKHAGWEREEADTWY